MANQEAAGEFRAIRFREDVAAMAVHTVIPRRLERD